MSFAPIPTISTLTPIHGNCGGYSPPLNESTKAWGALKERAQRASDVLSPLADKKPDGLYDTMSKDKWAGKKVGNDNGGPTIEIDNLYIDINTGGQSSYAQRAQTPNPGPPSPYVPNAQSGPQPQQQQQQAGVPLSFVPVPVPVPAPTQSQQQGGNGGVVVVASQQPPKSCNGSGMSTSCVWAWVFFFLVLAVLIVLFVMFLSKGPKGGKLATPTAPMVKK